MATPASRERPAFEVRKPIRFAQASVPIVWDQAGGASPVVDAIFSAIVDGGDRALLAWPARPCGGGVAAAVALRQARSSGRLSFATFGLWPWRPGSMSAARSVLVNPDDVLNSARRIVTACMREKPDWTKNGLAHQSTAFCELRMADLRLKHRQLQAECLYSPTLCETTIVFPPSQETPPLYCNDSVQIFRRVFRHTAMRKSQGIATSHLSPMGDVNHTPHALFGIPGTSDVSELKSLFSCQRFSERGLDVVVIDVTRTALAHIFEDWQQRLELFFRHLNDWSELRPPVVVLSDDPWNFQKAERLLCARQRRLGIPYPQQIGLYSRDGSLIGPPDRAPAELPILRIEADIKDVGLGPLRIRFLDLADRFREAEAVEAFRAVKQVLGDLRRLASLPLGVSEAREAAEDYHAGDNYEDLAVRALFLPKQSAALMRAAAVRAGRQLVETEALCSEFLRRAQAWDTETPVSAKLSMMLESSEWNRVDTLISIADGRIADLFAICDRGKLVRCTIATHTALADSATIRDIRRLIIISPDPTAIRFLLEVPTCFDRVVLIGDCAGIPLLLSMLAPLERMNEFGGICTRAAQLIAAVKQSGGDEGLDAREAQFRIGTAKPDILDFTQLSGAYDGEIAVIVTATGRHLRYRPGSSVLVSTDGEIRPFVERKARTLVPGDNILVLSAEVRDSLRSALAKSDKASRVISVYHKRIKSIRDGVSGSTARDKAHHVVRSMRKIEPQISEDEIGNVTRWLQADLQVLDSGARRVQPRAARDWLRFRVFMEAVGIDDAMAKQFWDFAILPTRSYRAQEGYAFNEAMVAFVLDPEGLGLTRSGWPAVRALRTTIEEAVEQVMDVKRIKNGVQNEPR